MSHVPTSLWPFGHQAAIFDFDGTLASSSFVWNEVDHTFLERRGHAWTPDLAQHLAALGFAEGALYVIDRYGLDEDPQDICDEWNALANDIYATEVDLRPGAREYLDALRASGIPLALATTNDHDVLASMAPRVDVYKLFDVVVCGTDVTKTKRHPDIYLEAARRLGVSPSGCIVFEDIVDGINSARRAGMVTCAVASGDVTQDPDAVRRAADVFLADWTDLAL
ncbi:MAG: HAD family phosphatase [Atopobiaceae bacterium]|nr:HAD family phosphatase [Atopobiaceae bacterium]